MLEAIFRIISYVMSWFTPERQTQRLKDELWRLKADKNSILLNKWSEKNEKKINAINTRIDTIERLLNNRAS